MFYKWEEIPIEEVRPGVRGRTISGEKVSMSYFELDPGAISPFHKHSNEQINCVLQGELEFTTDKEKRILKEGEIVLFPDNVPHQVKNIGDKVAVNLGALSPPRGKS